jgi:hypothetical protein
MGLSSIGAVFAIAGASGPSVRNAAAPASTLRRQLLLLRPLLQAASGILRPSTDDESNKTARTDEHLIKQVVTAAGL